MESSSPKFTLFGKEYPLVGPSDFSLGELCDAENYFGADFGDEDVSARKLAAILYTSVRRVDATVKPEHVRAMTAEDLAEVQKALEEWQGDQRPPAESSEREQLPSENGSGESSDVPSARDLSSTGDPPLGISSPSDRLTSVN